MLDRDIFGVYNHGAHEREALLMLFVMALPMNAGERLIFMPLVYLCIHTGYDGDRAFGAR